MKKGMLVLVGLVFLVACSGKEEQTAKVPNAQANCTINGHTCWEVIQLLGQTKIIQNQDTTEHPQEPWTHYIYTYENPALQDWGINVTNYDMYKDGGSTIHTLNNDVTIYTNRQIGSPRSAMGEVTVTFKDNTQYKFDRNGKPL